jgi:hypothetical protein
MVRRQANPAARRRVGASARPVPRGLAGFGPAEPRKNAVTAEIRLESRGAPLVGRYSRKGRQPCRFPVREGDFPMKRAGALGAKWFAGFLGMAFLGVMVAGSPANVAAAPPAKKEAKDKEAPLKAVPALKAKVDEKIAPFKWGMSSTEVFSVLDKEIDATYAEKVAKAYNPKQQAALEKEADKKKKDLRTKLIEFKGGGGVSGYEMKAPGEFTYKNNESAIEVPAKGGGQPHQLFFINDRLWKIYWHIELTSKVSELGETWDSAQEKWTSYLGAKGKHLDAKSTSPSYFGVLMQVPEHDLWTDGTTLIRLVNHTKREDMSARTVGVAFEEAATVDKLPGTRTHVEQKASDAQVDKAGFTPPPPPDKDKEKDKGKKK